MAQRIVNARDTMGIASQDFVGQTHLGKAQKSWKHKRPGGLLSPRHWFGGACRNCGGRKEVFSGSSARSLKSTPSLYPRRPGLLTFTF